MNINQNFIDEIVQGVLNQLQPSGATSASATSSGKETMLIDSSLLTAESLEQKLLPGTTQIQVGPKTVITPSGRDYLSQHKIDWSRSTTIQTGSTNSNWKVLAVKSSPFAKTVWNDLQTANDDTSAAQEAISMVCRGEASGIIILTAQPELVSCLSNRNEQVRAASVSHTTVSRGHLGRLITGFNPNVYCLDISEFSYMDLRNFWRQVSNN